MPFGVRQRCQKAFLCFNQYFLYDGEEFYKRILEKLEIGAEMKVIRQHRKSVGSKMAGIIGVASVCALLIGGMAGVSPASATATPVDEPTQPEIGTFSIDNSQARPLLDTVVVASATAENRYEVQGLPADVFVSDAGHVPNTVINLSKLGTDYGQLSPAFAVDAAGHELSSRYTVVNGKIYQSISVEESTSFPVVVAPSYVRTANSADASMVLEYRASLRDTSVPDVPTSGTIAGGLQSMQLAGISIPSNYVYNTNIKPKELHDYCTSSPDSFGNANFKGSCARHDLCIQAGLGLSTGARKARRAGCDSTLYTNLLISCSMANSNIVTGATCTAVAKTYYKAVTIATWVIG